MSKPKPKKYDLDTVLKFGKHRGQTIQDVVNEDPQYIWWAMSEVQDFEITNEVYDLLHPEINDDDIYDLMYF